MKKLAYLLFCTVAVLFVVFSCNKSERNLSYKVTTEESSAAAMDSSMTVADLTVKDKQFIKSAEVNMEVQDVYETTIFLEQSLTKLGGFMTSSTLNTQIMSEEIYSTSDEHAMLVRKFHTENTLKVRIPTERLSDFLKILNEKKVFLNSRVILAEDITANIKMATHEAERAATTGQKLEKLKTDKEQVLLSDANLREKNTLQTEKFQLDDQLKYSSVTIFIKEPKLRIAQIPVNNTANFENKYKFNFIYDLKNAAVEGFYLIQTLLTGLMSIWPIIIIISSAIYLWRRSKAKRKPVDRHNTK